MRGYRQWSRRIPAWAVLFAGALALFGITVLADSVTRNPRLLPNLIVLGAFTVPVSFVALVRDLLPSSGVPLRALVTCFVIGGVIGTAAASLVEYDALRDLDVLPALLVGAIEEPAKLVLPLIAFAVGAHRKTADGLLLGVASGMGFAAFETMGYALGALADADGNADAAERVMLLRGALAPMGHPAWTGLVCAALWWARRQDRRAAPLVALAAFLAAVGLHGAWDGLDSRLASFVVATMSAVLLLTWIVIARREAHEPLVAVAGLPDAVDRGSTRRAPAHSPRAARTCAPSRHCDAARPEVGLARARVSGPPDAHVGPVGMARAID
jgi:RsiW-degrading membrane proteinase PrsW (M82 family)